MGWRCQTRGDPFLRATRRAVPSLGCWRPRSPASGWLIATLDQSEESRLTCHAPCEGWLPSAREKTPDLHIRSSTGTFRRVQRVFEEKDYGQEDVSRQGIERKGNQGPNGRPVLAFRSPTTCALKKAAQLRDAANSYHQLFSAEFAGPADHARS